MSGRFFIARHGETVFNAAGRIQGDALHTPLTRAGFAQAEAMGEALRAELGPSPALTLWSSPAGRALQTLAVVAEHLELDWHSAHIDEGLAEIGMGEWSGRYHRDLFLRAGAPNDRVSGLLTACPPGGERFDEVARRVGAWATEQETVDGDRLVVMHAVSSRVLRALLTGAAERPGFGCGIADRLPQGSIACIEGGRETVILRAGGGAPA